MTPLDLLEASPATATLQIGAQAPAFEGLLGTDGKRYGFLELHRARRPRPDLLVEPLSNGEGVRGSDERPAARLRRRVACRCSRSTRTARSCIQTRAFGGWASALPRTAMRSRTWWTKASKLRGPTGRPARSTSSCSIATRRLRYQGRFDDARLPERVTSHDLRNAIEDVLDDTRVRRQHDAPIRMQHSTSSEVHTMAAFESTPFVAPPPEAGCGHRAGAQTAARRYPDPGRRLLGDPGRRRADRRLCCPPSSRADRGRVRHWSGPSRCSSSAGS